MKPGALMHVLFWTVFVMFWSVFPPRGRHVTLPPDPPRECGRVLALLPGADTLEVAQRGNVVSIEVRHRGGLRGSLLTLDLDTLTAMVERRPPAGWKIGPQ